MERRTFLKLFAMLVASENGFTLGVNNYENIENGPVEHLLPKLNENDKWYLIETTLIADCMSVFTILDGQQESGVYLESPVSHYALHKDLFHFNIHTFTSPILKKQISLASQGNALVSATFIKETKNKLAISSIEDLFINPDLTKTILLTASWGLDD